MTHDNPMYWRMLADGFTDEQIEQCLKAKPEVVQVSKIRPSTPRAITPAPVTRGHNPIEERRRDGEASISQYDSWVLGRIQAHDDLTPEQLDEVSGRWRPMAQSLAAKPLGDRVAAFDVMLTALPPEEAAALEEAIDAVDSDGPPLPEATVESADSWGPLRIGDPPPVEAFPADVFPEAAQRFCLEVAEATLCPVDFVGTAMLAVAGAAIGQSVNIEVKGGWREAPLLYAVLAADPGKAKTPSIRAATKPLVEFDTALRETSRLAREQWEARKSDYEKGKTEDPPGREPPRLRVLVKDITRESLCMVLADNPRGVLCSPDEATAWVGSWNQYKAKGTDEQFWLSLYSGDPVSVDRKGGRESILVPHPFCGLIGGIQPDLLADLRDDRGRDNGMLDRIVFSYPDTFPPHQWTEKALSSDAEQNWSDLVHRLASLEMRIGEDERPAPWVARFTPEARTRFIDWFNENGREMDEPGSRAGAMAKGEARLARLALILSRLRLACDPESALPSDDFVPPVEICDVEGAVRLSGYFASHRERVAYRMAREAGDADSTALLNWIKRNQRVEFREAEVREILTRFRSDPEALESAIAALTEQGVIRPKPEPIREGKPGRKPTPCHEVHPGLLSIAR